MNTISGIPFIEAKFDKTGTATNQVSIPRERPISSSYLTAGGTTKPTRSNFTPPSSTDSPTRKCSTRGARRPQMRDRRRALALEEF